MRITILFAIFAFILRTVGCIDASLSRNKNQKLYGYASWYYVKEEGKSTASMEKFDPTKFTAAHRRLPFGTYVRVTRLDSNKVVIVRINDRGPYKWKRIIDLSPAAAAELDLMEIGVTRVCVEVLGKNPPELEREGEKNGRGDSAN